MIKEFKSQFDKWFRVIKRKRHFVFFYFWTYI